MIEVKLAQFGMGMTDGTLVNWLKKTGERVTRGEILAEVEAAKSVVEIEAPCSGVLGEILVNVDENVPVHTVLARIEEDNPSG